MSAAPGGGWQPRDCHAHTTWSDGDLEPAALVAAVRARGVQPAITDHVTRDTTRALRSADAVSAYCDALEDLGVPDLAIGGEFCWHDTLWRELPHDVVLRLTHRLGSLHAFRLPDGTVLSMWADVPAGLTIDAYMDLHVAEIERLAAQMPVDILAHPTLLPFLLRTLPPEELWTEAREARAVAALARSRIAFEISNRYRPHERLVRRAYESGVLLSLGSDGHALDAVGDVTWPLALARAVGARDDELYDPFRHGSRTGARPERRAAQSATTAR